MKLKKKVSSVNHFTFVSFITNYFKMDYSITKNMFFNRKDYDWSVITSSFPDETNKELTYQTKYLRFKNIHYFKINCSVT